MNQAPRSRPRWPVGRRIAFIFLLLSLAIAGLGGHAFVRSLLLQAPAETEVLAGVVREVRYGYGRYDNIDNIRFWVGTEPRELAYAGFLPSFEQVKECLVEGATVTVSTSKGGTDIWSLTCPGSFSVKSVELLEAQRANGRAGAWVAVGFLIASGFWFWRISSRRAAKAGVEVES